MATRKKDGKKKRRDRDHKRRKEVKDKARRGKDKVKKGVKDKARKAKKALKDKIRGDRRKKGPSLGATSKRDDKIPSVHPLSSTSLAKDKKRSAGSKGAIPSVHEISERPRSMALNMTTTETGTYSTGGRTRETWGSRFEFFLSLLGFAIGLGNVWRFPFMAYKNGGGTFLVPYFIMLIFVGLPIIMLEVGIGQYSGFGPIECFREMCPIACGLGFAEVTNSFLIAIYYNVILAWAVLYFFEGMQSPLPWADCSRSDASVMCDNNMPAVDYFTVRALGQNPLEKVNWGNYGQFNGRLFGCFTFAWLLVMASLIAGIKSSGKVVYFTATFPFLVVIILFIRGVTLDGADIGIYFYLTPDVTKLGEVTVWTDAATQIFFSVGCALGGNIAYSSYNKFTHPGHRDAVLVGLINCGFSIFAGFGIFSIIGYMAKLKGMKVYTQVSKRIRNGSNVYFFCRNWNR